MFQFGWFPRLQLYSGKPEILPQCGPGWTGPGFPIRTPPDQSFVAAPRRLSRPCTSFIGNKGQGIHCLHFLDAWFRTIPLSGTDTTPSSCIRNRLFFQLSKYKILELKSKRVKGKSLVFHSLALSLFHSKWVDLGGLEPPTSSLQMRCSNLLNFRPKSYRF